MATGMWTAVSGASAQSQQVDTVANNLANADTVGFKKDAPAFREYLSVLEREPSHTDIPRGPIKDRDLHPLDGRDQAFVVVDGTYTDFKQGSLKVTQSPLDLAIDGPGFFEVSTPSGSRFTRHGGLKVSADGRLVNSQGFPLLAASPGGLVAPLADGRAPASDPARFIDLRDRKGPLTINEAGEIYSGEDLVAKLSVVEFKEPTRLRKAGGSLFVNPDPTNISSDPARSLVRQGVLETSNVNPVEEMTKLIKANRLFEQDMKALKTFGELMGREANDIGKL